MEFTEGLDCQHGCGQGWRAVSEDLAESPSQWPGCGTDFEQPCRLPVSRLGCQLGLLPLPQLFLYIWSQQGELEVPYGE